MSKKEKTDISLKKKKQLMDKVKKNQFKIDVLKEENKKMAKLALGKNGLQAVKENTEQQNPNPFDELAGKQMGEPIAQPQVPTQPAEAPMPPQHIQQQMEQQMPIQQPMVNAEQAMPPQMPIAPQPIPEQVQEQGQEQGVEITITMMGGHKFKVPVPVSQVGNFETALNESIASQEAFQLGSIWINGRNILFYG